MGVGEIKWLDHMTDMEIEVTGFSLEDAFENAGLATEETMTDTSQVTTQTIMKFDLTGIDEPALLYAFLDKIISIMDSDGMVFNHFECDIWQEIEDSVQMFRLLVCGYGEVFDSSRHESRTAIKAPTFHSMSIHSENETTTIHFLLDL